jgi:hypothetical protein
MFIDLNRKAILSFLLLALLTAGAGGSYLLSLELFNPAAAQALPEKVPLPLDSAKASLAALAEARLQAAKKLQDEVRVSIPPSPWSEAEKKRYLDLLAAAKPSVVVLPFQISEANGQFGVDLSARMVMAYMTAQRIASGASFKVADVEIAARAIGEQRRFTRADALRFATSVGAASVVYGEVSHDAAGHLAISIAKVENISLRTADKIWTKSGLNISDVVTPELAYQKVVDEAVAQLGFAVSKSLDAGVYVASAKPLPDSPVRATTDAPPNPADGIWMQELIGSLYPEDPSRARDRIFERALAGTEYLSQDTVDYRLLKARALARLGRRIAAISTIGNSARTPEEKAFIAFLNGSVPEMEQAVAQIKRPVPKLIAELELVWVDAAYSGDVNKLSQIAERIAKTAPTQWAPTIVWYITGQNAWNVGQTMQVKLVLDAQFPVKGYSADEVVRAKSVVGGADSKIVLEIQGTPLTHAARALEQSGVEWCCETQTWKPRPFQYLDLLAAHAEAMLVRSVEFMGNVQGRGDDALQLADALDEAIFNRGSIALRVRKARLLMNSLPRAPSREQTARILEQVYQIAVQVRHWNAVYPAYSAENSGYERAAAQVHFEEIFRKAPGVFYPETDDFKRDFPPAYEAFHFTSEYGAAVQGITEDFPILENACLYSLLSPQPCEAWRARLEATDQPEPARKVETEQLVNRFHGSPRRTEILVALFSKRGEIDRAAVLAREIIKLKPGDWQGYRALGDIYMSGGRFHEAGDAYLSYPSFKNAHDENTVGISNAALSVAYELARRGAVKEARPLLEVAARDDNGSAASLAARAGVAYGDRRYGDAELFARERVQRYGDGPAMRTYLSLLFALGDSQNGWAGVQEALQRISGFSQWRAVPVGFRVDGADIEAVRKWAKDNSTKRDPRLPDSMNVQALQAITVSIQTLAMDRPVAFMEQLPIIRKEIIRDPEFSTANLDNISPEQREQRQKAMEAIRVSREKERRERPGEWKDYLDRFVAGYIAFKRGDYNASWEAFQDRNEAALFEDARDASYAGLPYHAFSAVKAGQAEAFAGYLDKWVKPQQPTPPQRIAPAPFPEFDAHLARAVLAAAKGNHDDAKKELRYARNTIAEPGTRPLPPEYVYAEVCEMLGADSGIRDYLDMAVNWARAYQSYEPWAAWAYAFEAKYGKANADRARALAIAQYLDRNSIRTTGIEANIVRQAKTWLAANKPFPRERRAPNQKAL